MSCSGYISRTFLIFIFTALILSCGARKTIETQSPTYSLERYSILQIPDFDTTIEDLPYGLRRDLPDQITKKLEDAGIFKRISRSPLNTGEEVLILKGTITDVHPREWYRHLVRTGRIVVKMQLVDKSERLIIAEAFFEGTARWGLLGGSMLFADIRVVDEITDYILHHMSSAR